MKTLLSFDNGSVLFFFASSRLRSKKTKTMKLSHCVLLMFLGFFPGIILSQNVSADMIYSLQTGTETQQQQFYPARFNSAFTPADYEKMMLVSAKHVMQQLAAG